jgi:Transposase DDE domain
LPVAFDRVTKTEPYVDAKTGKTRRRRQLTKNARYRMLLQLCVPNQIKFGYVLNDSWYASADKMNFIKRDLKKDFVMPLKANRKVALSEQDQQAARYVTVSSRDLLEGETRQIWLEDVGFSLLLAKQVFINDDGSTGTLYLLTSDLTLTYERMTSLYEKRFGVEGYHKSVKQNASLEKSPTRTETTQQNHFFASLCA